MKQYKEQLILNAIWGFLAGIMFGIVIGGLIC